MSRSFAEGGDGAVQETARTSTYVGAAVEYTGMLVVTVVSAAGLPSMDIGSASDPYVVLRLRPGQERRTKVGPLHLLPRWTPC